MVLSPWRAFVQFRSLLRHIISNYFLHVTSEALRSTALVCASECPKGRGLIRWEGSRLQPLVHFTGVALKIVWGTGEMILTGKTEPLTGRPVPVHGCRPQISHVLAWGRTMAWPCLYFSPRMQYCKTPVPASQKTHWRSHFFN